jgi:adenylate cyclase
MNSGGSRNAQRRLTLGHVRSVTGMILGLYVLLHLSNHALGLISVRTQEAARPWVMAFWHSWIGQVLLYGSIIIHAGLGLSTLFRRRHFRMPWWEAGQTLLGLCVPYLLLVHITNTRGTRILSGIDIDYVYEIANLWVSPSIRLQQVALVILVWGHFVMGLHFWWRNYPWYRKAFPGMVLTFVLIPLCALLGFAQAGMKMSAQAAEHPEWYREISTRGIPKNPKSAQLRAGIKRWAGPGWLMLVAVVFSAGRLRNLIRRNDRFAVTYPDIRTVVAPVGMSVLEVSRMVKRPHMSVCGGRGRCTTCRIWIGHSAGPLDPPNETERCALTRIGAPATLRLACQLKPHADIAVNPVINPDTVAAHQRSAQGSQEFGMERTVSILFMDIRGSTQLAEGRLPFDVVFLLNHFFAEMADAVAAAGGHYSNFTGDGLMALFGLEGTARAGARSALSCALGMFEKLAAVNARLMAELHSPLSIGVGVHTGAAIVGRMGPPKTPILSALGDAVNVTARLESLTKELNAPLVVSWDTLEAAGIGIELPLQEVTLKGRSNSIRVAAMDMDLLSLCLLRLGEMR